LTKNAAPQRAGILGSLNEAGKPLRMMPAAAEGRRIWDGTGVGPGAPGLDLYHIHAGHHRRAAAVAEPVLDMLILKLQAGERQPGQNRVWMILDELASLNALPQCTVP